MCVAFRCGWHRLCLRYPTLVAGAAVILAQTSISPKHTDSRRPLRRLKCERLLVTGRPVAEGLAWNRPTAELQGAGRRSTEAQTNTTALRHQIDNYIDFGWSKNHKL